MPPQKAYNILYIDDEQGNLTVFHSTFRREYGVYTALSGTEGLAIMEKYPIQLVIVDQQMPEMQGVDVLRIITKKYPETIRMILTGYSDLQGIIYAINECGLFRYLTKPWNAEDMTNAIATGLETFQLRKDNERLLGDLKNLNASLEERIQEQTQSLQAQREKLLVFNKELEESKLFLEQINALSPNMIYVLDANSLIMTYHNARVEEILDFTQEGVRNMGGKWLLDAVHPDDQDTLRKHYASMKLYDQGEGRSLVYRMKDRMGNWRWLHDTHVVFKKNAEGHRLLVMGMAKDITELKEVELALKASEERLKDTQQLARLVRWEMDPETSLIEWYSSNIDLSKLPEGDYLHFNSYLEIIHPKDGAELEANQNALVKNGIAYEQDIRYRNVNGREVHMHIKAQPLFDEHGKLLKVVGSAMDITRLKAYEQKLHQLNESKDRILATVAHDLRNPINNIQGLTTILKLQMPQVNEDTKDVFARIETSCKKGLNLISELLEIAELENEGHELPMEAVVFDDFLNQVLVPFQEKAIHNHVHFQKEFNCEGVEVSLNHSKFSRMVENLLTNALKFTAEGGGIKVATQITAKGKVLLSIADTGIGIPKEMQPLIFDKFSKAARTGLKGEKSTGLGMSIVKQVVELHNGHIWLESEEGKGTAFYIELPVYSEGEMHHPNKIEAGS